MTPRPGTPLVAMMLGLGLAFGPSPATAEAGHALAERFAAGAAEEDARRKAEEAQRRTAEEAEMLARARTEAMERKAAADKARAEEEAREAARIAEEKRAEEARRLATQQRRAREQFIAEQIRAEEERQRIAEEQRLAEEKRIAEEKRAEEKRQRAEAARIAEERRLAEQKRQRLAEEQRRAEERRIAEEKRAEQERQRAEAARIAEETRVAEEERLAEEERRTEERRLALAAEHEASHARRAERIRQLEEERNAKTRTSAKQPATDPMGLGGPSHATPHATAESPAPAAAPPAGIVPVAAADTRPAAPPERVTVLLVMKPGASGIRRLGRKTADPVICSGPTCWIGAGADRAARTVTRGLALGPGNTMGTRAAACNQRLACVFRDVNLRGPSASIQPIDLRVLRHDRREPQHIEADRSCRLANGALVCDKLFASRSWRAWVIDEELARKAGPAALAAALESGLAPSPSAALHVQNF